MKRFPKADNEGKLTAGPMRISDSPVAGYQSSKYSICSKAEAVKFFVGVHLGKISTKECRSIRGGLGCFGVS
ncbi:MAG: hypothetical protein DWH95_09720 [Planctomycetota bacterium]|nr:MAG: hypothetical protein DWH95_09720 [Planctomycetota bacterium]